MHHVCYIFYAYMIYLSLMHRGVSYYCIQSCDTYIKTVLYIKVHNETIVIKIAPSKYMKLCSVTMPDNDLKCSKEIKFDLSAC